MKINFEDGSFISCEKQDDQIVFVIQAKDSTMERKNIINAVSLSLEEFKKLISDIKA